MLREKRTEAEAPPPTAGTMPARENPFVEYVRRGMNAVRKLAADSTTRKNLIVLASGSILAFVIPAISGLFGGIQEWERQNNLSKYHAGEFAVLIVVLALTAMI